MFPELFNQLEHNSDTGEDSIDEKQQLTLQAPEDANREELNLVGVPPDWSRRDVLVEVVGVKSFAKVSNGNF